MKMGKERKTKGRRKEGCKLRKRNEAGEKRKGGWKEERRKEREH